MTATIHTKGQNNWQPTPPRTQWQREKRDGRIRPMHRPSLLRRLAKRAKEVWQ